MLEIFNTGWAAKQFGKHRGWFAVFGGVVVWLIAFFVLKAQDVIYAFAPQAVRPGDGLTHLDWTAIVLLVVGVLIALFGAWQLYRDEVHGDYLAAADRYRREGW